MAWERILAVGIPLLVFLVAVWGALRVAAVRRWVPDPRLAFLATFFWLYAFSWLLQAGGILLYYEAAQTALERGEWDVHDSVFVVQHGLMVIALGSAVLAFRPPRPALPLIPDEAVLAKPLALAPFLLVAEPTFRLVESVGFLYLALRSALNHKKRQDVGSLRVATGFLLVLAAHALLGYLHTPLGPHFWVADILALAGTLVLVTASPRRGG